MAWTTIKQDVLKDLLRERITIENTIGLSQEWDLSRTWMQILNSYVNDTIKQSILNDLIDDKVHYLQLKQNFNSASTTAIQVTIDQGLALKE